MLKVKGPHFDYHHLLNSSWSLADWNSECMRHTDLMDGLGETG